MAEAKILDDVGLWYSPGNTNLFVAVRCEDVGSSIQARQLDGREHGDVAEDKLVLEAGSLLWGVSHAVAALFLIFQGSQIPLGVDGEFVSTLRFVADLCSRCVDRTRGLGSLWGAGSRWDER